MLALAGLCVGVYGCAPNEAPTVDPMESAASFAHQTWDELLHDTTLEELVQERRTKRREAAAEGTFYFGSDRELDIALVRIVELDEWAQVHADCMTEAGFPVVVSGGGVSAEDVPDEQAEELNYANYRCSMQYPINPLGSLPYPQEPASQLYDYWTGTVVPCLTAQGESVSEPPSKEVWMSQMASGIHEWDPFTEAENRLHEEEPAKLNELYVACPEFPAGFFSSAQR